MEKIDKESLTGKVYDEICYHDKIWQDMIRYDDDEVEKIDKESLTGKV